MKAALVLALCVVSMRCMAVSATSLPGQQRHLQGVILEKLLEMKHEVAVPAPAPAPVPPPIIVINNPAPAPAPVVAAQPVVAPQPAVAAQPVLAAQPVVTAQPMAAPAPTPVIVNTYVTQENFQVAAGKSPAKSKWHPLLGRRLQGWLSSKHAASKHAAKAAPVPAPAQQPIIVITTPAPTPAQVAAPSVAAQPVQQVAAQPVALVQPTAQAVAAQPVTVTTQVQQKNVQIAGGSGGSKMHPLWGRCL